jgi:hypothetical protein
MPIPNPGKKESKNEFISRCMSNDGMNKEYEQKQRYAICMSQWEEVKKKGSAVLKTPTDEYAIFMTEEEKKTCAKDLSKYLDQ